MTVEAGVLAQLAAAGVTEVGPHAGLAVLALFTARQLDQGPPASQVAPLVGKLTVLLDRVRQIGDVSKLQTSAIDDTIARILSA